MEILRKDKYDEFERFCSSHPHGAFQQSPYWGNVKTEWDSEIVVIRNGDGKITAGIFILIRKLGIKTMMYACRGPVCDYTDKAVISELMDGVKEVAKKHKAYVFIMDPLVTVDDEKTISLFKECGLTIKEHARFHDTIQPRYNYMLNYIKGMSIDELMAKSELFADFKAVKEGNVWTTGKSLYQATDIVGQLIRDLNLMLTGGDASQMTFLTKVE